MIIIPDVHGRSFWKKAVENAVENERIIFLGDYLDPYYREYDPIEQKYITEESALENFKSIVKFANENNNVLLLLGNHDCEYIFGTTECRYDYINAKSIADIFKNNLRLFKFGYYQTICEKTYTFSHSCIRPKWIESCENLFKKDCSVEDCIDILNDRLVGFKNRDEKLTDAIDKISRARGGTDLAGSIIWADAGEVDTDFIEANNAYMIFGHTQQRQDPIIEDEYAMLDCRKAFRLNEDTGEITMI